MNSYLADQSVVHRAAAPTSPLSVLEMPHLGATLELMRQNLPSTKTPRCCVYTLKLEKSWALGNASVSRKM